MTTDANSADDAAAAEGFTLPSELSSKRAALVVAHPGHELRVYGWIKLSKPSVSVVTDGSGHGGSSRLASTTGILAHAGATAAPLYGRFTDVQVYDAILRHDFGMFTRLADELSEYFLESGVEYVVSDASEGYNPTHDLCRIIVDAAVAVARRARPLVSFDFPLIAAPDACAEAQRNGAVRLRLDDQTFCQKLAAARAFEALKRDVEAGFAEFGEEAYRIECLRPVLDRNRPSGFPEGAPSYERYGEKQVAAGYYRRVLRYREHFAPAAEALGRYVEQVKLRFGDENSHH